MSYENSSTQTAAAVADDSLAFGRDGERLMAHAQSPGTPVYLVMFGTRRHVPDETTYFNLFANWDGIIIDPDLGSIPEGPPLTSGALLMRATGTAPVYLLTNGLKHWVTSQEAMTRYAFDYDKVQEWLPIAVDSIPSGPDINWPQ
jgi:hypothetical protein